MTKEVGQFILTRARELSQNSQKITIFDGTLGHAGHVLYLCELLNDMLGLYVATDIDKEMFDTATRRLETELPANFAQYMRLYNVSYTDFDVILDSLKKTGTTLGYDVVFLDLGVNLRHFKKPTRGFSIKGDGFLDMRYDTTHEGKTAADVVNTYSEQELIDIFMTNSEITFVTSKTIAQSIITFRKKEFFETTEQLNMLVKHAGYSARVAAIVFQAIRIEVNKEFSNIIHVLDRAHACMNPGGILIILSYHSGEDRVVKEAMKKMQERGLGTIITKHTTKPSFHEISKNKPSRSAQLRVFQYM